MDPETGSVLDGPPHVLTGLKSLRVAQYVSAGTTSVIGAIALAGWSTGALLFASVSSAYKPMSPVSAIVFLLLAVLVVFRVRVDSPRGRPVVFLVAGVVFVTAALEMVDMATGLPVAPNRFFLSAIGGSGAFQVARMSAVTAVAFLGLAVALGLHEFRGIRYRATATALALLMASWGFVMLVGYAYEAPLFYDLGIRPTSFLTSAALWVIGMGIAAFGTDRWPFALFIGDSVRAELARVVFPVAIVPMFALALLQSITAGLGLGQAPLIVAALFLATVGLITLGVLRATTWSGERLERAQRALAESEQWLARSQRIAQLGHYIYDLEGDIWRGSPSLYSVLGIDERFKRDFAGWLSIVHPADRERMSRHFAEEVLGRRARFDMEYRIIRPRDVFERWVHSVGDVEWHEDGHPVAMFGITQDVTGHRLVEDELNRERMLLARAEVIGHVGSWRLTLDDGEVEWSEEAERIVGFDSSSHTAEPFDRVRSVLHPDDRERFDTWVRSALESAEPNASDFRIVRSDGEVRWVCAHSLREKGRLGEPVIISGIVQDVTERKRSEEERIDLLEQEANIDRLTGLLNRRGFELVAEQSLAQAQRGDQGIGMIFCDLDGLKTINDEFGHPQGDRALRDAASILKFTLRSADAIARIGGDEFVVLTVGGDRNAVVCLNERLQEGLEFFNSTKERSYRLSISTGTAWSEPGAPCRLEDLRAAADSNMYAEKSRRRLADGGRAS